MRLFGWTTLPPTEGEALGRADHFLPPKTCRELVRLELEIWSKFLGDNYDDLARQYDMTVSGMRKLITRIRTKLAADTQYDLFDPARVG